jgi:hypothetical protein
VHAGYIPITNDYILDTYNILIESGKCRDDASGFGFFLNVNDLTVSQWD